MTVSRRQAGTQLDRFEWPENTGIATGIWAVLETTRRPTFLLFLLLWHNVFVVLAFLYWPFLSLAQDPLLVLDSSPYKAASPFVIVLYFEMQSWVSRLYYISLYTLCLQQMFIISPLNWCQKWWLYKMWKESRTAYLATYFLQIYSSIIFLVTPTNRLDSSVTL